MRMTVKFFGVIAALCLLLASVPAVAHHSFAAAFDENNPINLQGTVTKVELVNPHAWIWLDVKGQDGSVTHWGIEGGRPTNLLRNGSNKTSLPIGTEINLCGYRAKSGQRKGVGVCVEYLDGRKISMGRAAPGADGNPTPSKKE